LRHFAGTGDKDHTQGSIFGAALCLLEQVAWQPQSGQIEFHAQD
jgi:hypothetical protein